VQLLDESLLFGTDVFIDSHVSYIIIDWLSHNNARDEITLRFISFFFFKRYLLYVLSFISSVLPFFLSFMSFVLPFFFFVVYVVCIAILCCSLPFILPFFIVFNRLYYRSSLLAAVRIAVFLSFISFFIIFNRLFIIFCHPSVILQ